MKRPLLTVGTGYALATWASFLLSGRLLVASVICAVVGISVFLFRKNRVAVSVFLLSAALALAARSLHDSFFVRPLLNRVGDEVTAVGVITQADYDSRSFSLTFSAEFPGQSLPSTTLSVRGYGEMDYRAGDALRCSVRLEELKSSLNYYNSRGIFVSARMIASEPAQLPKRLEAERFFVLTRMRMLDTLRGNLPSDAAELLAGMVLGERSGLDDAAYEALRRAGTVHLLSVSGLHLSVLVGFIAKLVERLTKNRKLQAFACGCVAVLFAALTGFSPSVTRALVMTLVMLLARAVSRRSDSLSSLSLALLLICIAAPHWVLNTGLWLSASSTAGIAVLSRPLEQRLLSRYRRESRLIQGLSGLFFGAVTVTVAAYSFSFPVLLLTGGWVSPVAPAANVLIAPLVAPALLCGIPCVFLSGPLLSPFSAIATDCVRMILGVSELMAGFPLAFALDELWCAVWLLLAAGMIIFLIRLRADKSLWRYSVLLLVISFAAGSVTSELGMRGKVELVAIERCSSVILLRGGSAVVVGTPSMYEIGRLIRYLDFRGVKSLDAIVAHDQGEQIGSGLIRLAERYDAGLIVGPDDDYILSEIALAIPGREVLSFGYATLRVMDGVQLQSSLSGDAVEIRAGQLVAVKSNREYDIIENSTPSSGQIRIWRDGILVWTDSAPPAFEPVGGMLFGERRLVLSC